MRMLLFAVLVVLIPMKAKTDFVDGNRLLAQLKLCHKEKVSQQDAYECGRGHGYILSSYDASNFDTCGPANLTKGQLTDAVEKYLNDNPEDLHDAANSLVLFAFNQAWPCPERVDSISYIEHAQHQAG